MKTFRLFGMTLLMVMLTVNFTACSKDDELISDSNTEWSVGKKIAQVNLEYDDNICTIMFNYNNSKLSEFVWTYDNDDPIRYEFNQKITSSDGKVIMKGEVDGNECEQIYTLDNNGYAISCLTNDKSSKHEIFFEYTPDGYLSKIIDIDYPLDNSHNKKATYIYTFAYENGILKKATEELDYSTTYHYTYTFNYTTDTPNKSKLVNPIVEELIFDFLSAYYSGMLGRPCKQLPNSYERVDKYGYSEQGDFLYTLNDEQYVTDLIYREPDRIYKYKYQYME